MQFPSMNEIHLRASLFFIFIFLLPPKPLHFHSPSSLAGFDSVLASFRSMEFTTELCLAPTRKQHHHRSSEIMPSEYSSESESNSHGVMNGNSRKRKMTMVEMMGGGSRDHHDHHREHHVVDLHHHLDREVAVKNKPLPLDWEQCLDLDSGMMYYFNRKTSKKSWNWPKDANHHDADDRSDDQNNKALDLELNISSSSNKYYHNNVNGDHHQHVHQETSNHHHHHQQILASTSPSEEGNFSTTTTSDHSSTNDKDNNMVALACLNCHLLVILSKSSPCCPNCKFVHSLPPTLFHHSYPSQPNSHNKVQFPPKPISTLSLLN